MVALVAARLLFDRAAEKVFTRKVACWSVKQMPLPNGYPGIGLKMLERVARAVLEQAAMTAKDEKRILDLFERVDKVRDLNCYDMQKS